MLPAARRSVMAPCSPPLAASPCVSTGSPQPLHGLGRHGEGPGKCAASCTMAPDEPEEPEGGHEGETFDQFYRLQKVAHAHALPDLLLQTFVTIINRTDLAFTVTLFVHGAIVSGLMVDLARFHDELSAFMERSGGDSAQIITIALREM